MALGSEVQLAEVRRSLNGREGEDRAKEEVPSGDRVRPSAGAGAFEAAVALAYASLGRPSDSLTSGRPSRAVVTMLIRVRTGRGGDARTASGTMGSVWTLSSMLQEEARFTQAERDSFQAVRS